MGSLKTRRFETIQLHGDASSRKESFSCSVPIDPSASFRFYSSEEATQVFSGVKEGFAYSRFGNPTVEVFEKRMIALEGGRYALAVSSGAAAVLMTVLALAKAGDNILSSRSLYCGTVSQFDSLLPSLGIETRYFNCSQSSDLKAKIDDKTKLVFAESIGNPNLDVADLDMLVEIGHEAGVPVVIDATFNAGSFFGSPIDHGVDIVVHSATKWISGHGTTLGGIIIDSGQFDFGKHVQRFPQFHRTSSELDASSPATLWNRFGPEALTKYLRYSILRDFGSSLSPFSAQQLLIGMETLSLRCERQASNAHHLALWLRKQPAVAWVKYIGWDLHPSFTLAKQYLRNGRCSVFTFGTIGGSEAACKLIDGFKLIISSSNIGDSKTIVGHPWSTTHSQLTVKQRLDSGVSEDLVRISAGTENIDDLIEDFEQSFQSSATAALKDFKMAANGKYSGDTLS